MFRCFLIILFWCVAAGAQAEVLKPSPLRSAFHAAGEQRWGDAYQLAARGGPDAIRIIDWWRLQAGQGRLDQAVAFMRENPDWPGLDRIRRKHEDLLEGAAPDQVRTYFQGSEPQTGTGVLALARALDAEAAKDLVVAAWQVMDLSPAEHDQFIAQYSGVLAPYHDTRMRMVLWRGLKDRTDMLPLVSDRMRQIAEARHKIVGGNRGLGAWIDDLPDNIKFTPIVAHALFEWLIARDRTSDAVRLINHQSQTKGALGRPDRWASWRRFMARGRMRDGEPKLAYQLASQHQLSEGSNFADLEWLSGYLALNYLKDPALALDHFQRFRGAVKTPISLGRAGYWLGRAQEALGDAEAAQVAYAQGAAHQTSFYGILAAERAELPFDIGLGQAVVPRDFRDVDLFNAGALALRAGRLSLAEQFFVALAATLDETGLKQLAVALQDLDAPHLEVMLGKAAAKRSIVLPEAYYALHPMAQRDLSIPAELALAIARRESEFDPGVVSGAGAQGLMQLMPGTARDMAGDLGLEHEPDNVLESWRYNTQLGSEYLRQMAEQFDGNPVMMSAAYNAGPRRPERWMRDRGDPRQGGMDIIDWIEHIPFRETRNYVMRVTESLIIYRARLGQEPLPQPFSKELSGSSLRN